MIIQFSIFRKHVSVVLFCTTLLASINTFAQKDFYFGGYAGLNASQFSGDEIHGFNKFGAYGGIFTGQELNDTWHWELGLVFSQKGSYQGNIAGNSSRRYLLNVNYIEVPLAFRYFFKLVHLEFGSAFGTMVGYREDNLYGPVNDPREFSRFEISGFVGVLYEINDRFGIMARFSNSILPVRDHFSGATYLWNRGQYHTVITGAVRIGI